jgi:hypothetical protein
LHTAMIITTKSTEAEMEDHDHKLRYGKICGYGVTSATLDVRRIDFKDFETINIQFYS